MKLRHLLVLAGLFATGLLWAGETNLTLTIDGVIYSNVTWGAATPANVKLFHRTGVAIVDLDKLPPDLQAQFNYNPEKAAAYRAANTPPPETPVKMLDRIETGNALAAAVNSRGYSDFKMELWTDEVDPIRERYKLLLDLKKAGCDEYQPAIEQFIEACKRSIERHYELKHGAPPEARDQIGSNPLYSNIARQNIDQANTARKAYSDRVARLKEEALGHLDEGHRLKTAVDNKGRPVPVVKPKPAPTDPYLEEMP